MTERYYQAASEKSHLQITTSKGGLIVTLANRALGNGEWTTIILNTEQAEGLRAFINETQAPSS